jgi:hypothetical protein
VPCPHWLNRNSRERRRSVLPARAAVRKFCKSANEDTMRVWLACKPIVRRSAQLATRSWSATTNDRVASSCVAWRTWSIFFGTINRISSWVFDLARARPPRLDCQANLAPLAPLRRGFTFEGNRYRAVRGNANSGEPWSEMDIAT